MANRYYIRNVSLDVNISQTSQKLISKNLTNAVGLDYDWREKKIYWSDVTNSEHSISRMNFDGSGVQVSISDDPPILSLVTPMSDINSNCMELTIFVPFDVWLSL